MKHPPIWIWPAAAALTGLVLIILVTCDSFSSAGAAAALNLDRLARDPPESIRVVAIGSSKSISAIPFDADVTAQLQALGVNARFHRITRLGPTAGKLRFALEALQARPPQLLLIEEDLLLLKPHAYIGGNEPWRTQALANLRGLLGLTSPRSMENFGLVDSLQSKDGCEYLALDLQAYLKNLSEIRVSSPVERGAYLTYLRGIKRAGAKVVLLQIPRSPEADRMFPRALNRAVLQLRTDLAAAEEFATWSPVERPPQDDYCDPGHLNRRGRSLYANWLAQKLAQTLQAPDA